MLLIKDWARALAILPLAFLGACTQHESSPTSAEEKFQSGPVSALTSDPNLAGAGGVWTVVQGNYDGTLVLKQSGATVIGYMDWRNHADASVRGSVLQNGVSLTFSYLDDKAGVVGKYDGTFSSDRTTLSGGSGSAAWTATSATFLQSTLGGCWRIEQGSYSGSLTLSTYTSGSTLWAVVGFMDWYNHTDAVVRGTFDPTTNTVKMNFIYEGATAVGGVYEATVRPDRMVMEGVTYSPANPYQQTPWSGYAAPCKDASGCFRWQMHDGDMWYNGLARVTWNGYDLTGTVDWDGRGRSTLSGSLATREYFFTLKGPVGSPMEGRYTSLISYDADEFWHGSFYRGGGTERTGSFRGEPGRVLCPE